jgi:tRNA A-37 threonylcarbamoyl transferase component Bud32
LIEERFGPLRRRAWLITEFCAGPNLREHLSSDCPPPPEEAKAITSLFRTMHELRISHGDLKATNLLWYDGQVIVIDLDATVQHRSSSAHARAWCRDRTRLLRNWPAGSVLVRWLEANLPRA